MYSKRPTARRVFCYIYIMDSTQRFSNRVEDYVRYRPGYPKEVFGPLESRYNFTAAWTVADIGSGTGISTALFLEHGNRVYGVEPNLDMRRKAESLLSGYKAFVSVEGTAEATWLPSASVDLIVAGQAFHWFDPQAARTEFTRIGKPGVCVALLWNERRTTTPFEKAYDGLIQYFAGEYKTESHRPTADLGIERFFGPSGFVLDQFENGQQLDLEGLKGRLLSSSYVPKEGPVYTEMIESLEGLFTRYAAEGKVRIGYDTKLYSGRLDHSS